MDGKTYAQVKEVDIERFMWREVICKFGLPKEIVANNGTQFTSSCFKDFCDRWKITHSFLTLRYPHSNGQVVATNKTILNKLKKKLKSYKGRWSDELLRVLGAYRMTPHTATDESPFSMV